MNKSHIDALAAAITAGIVAYVNTFPTEASVSEVADNDAQNAADVTGQVDSAGFPWDERIHSGAKTTKADGTWTYKKGASSLVAAVEAELRAKGHGVAAPAAPVISAPVVPSLTITAPVISAPVIEAPKSEYTKLCDLIAANSDKLNAAWVKALFDANGVPGGLPSLANDEDRSKQFYDSILTVLPKV